MFTTTLVVIALCGVTSTAHAGQPTNVELSYEEFAKLNIQERRERFRQASPEAKAHIVQRHGRRWLDDNRKRLADAQIAAVEELIGFFGPERFRNPTEPNWIKREQVLSRELRCLVGDDAFDEAFAVLHPPSPRRRTWRSFIDESLEWFVNCVMP